MGIVIYVEKGSRYIKEKYIRGTESRGVFNRDKEEVW